MTDILKTTVGDAIQSSSVPNFDYSAIVNRATRARVQPRKGRSWLLGLALLGLPCIAAAAVVFPSPSVRSMVQRMMANSQLPAKSVAVRYYVSRETTAAQALREARFKLPVPAGLPRGARLDTVFDNGNAHTSYSFEYILASGKHVRFTLERAQPHTRYLPWTLSIPTDASGNVSGRAKKVPVRMWLAGEETVTVPATAFSPSQFLRVKRAMDGRDAPLLPPGKAQR